MKKSIRIGIGVGILIVAIMLVVSGPNQEPVPPVTQQDLREMVDQWMNEPDEDDRNQRLEIMKAYYTFEESGQKLTNDQEGRVLDNQIIKMVSFDIPKTELNQIKEEIRAELRELGFKIDES